MTKRTTLYCCRNGNNTSCFGGCLCGREWFEPVCGVDGLTYFSPCYAGCQNSVGDTVGYLGIATLQITDPNWTESRAVLFPASYMYREDLDGLLERRKLGGGRLQRIKSSLGKTFRKSVKKVLRLKGKKVKECIWGSHLTAAGRHLPYGITQCYVPPDTGECTRFNLIIINIIFYIIVPSVVKIPRVKS